MGGRLIRIFMIAATAIVFIHAGAFLAREFTKLSTIVRMGDMWSFIGLAQDRGGVFREVDLRDFPGPPYPAVGDTLLEVGGRRATQAAYFEVFTPDTPSGTSVPIVFRRGSEVLTNTVVTRSIPLGLKTQLLILFTLRVLLTITLIWLGLWAYLRRPEAPAVRTLTLFCYSMVLAMLVGRAALSDAYAQFNLPLQRAGTVVFQGLALFAPAFWTRLQLLFPAENGFYRSRRALVNLLLFGPGFAIGLASLRFGGATAPFAAVYQILLLFAGSALLIRNHRRADSFLVKRQTWLVFQGSLPSMAYMIVLGLAFVALPRLPLRNVIQLYLLNLNFILLLFIPVSFAYAFGRYRLLEIEGRIKRGTRFAALNVGLLVVIVGILYVFGDLLLKQLSIESRTPTLALGLLLALGFAPAQRRIYGVLERKFYPERVRLRRLLVEFLHSAGRTVDAERFWRELGERLGAGLSAQQVFPILRGGRTGYRAVNGAPAISPQWGDDLIRRLNGVDHPVLVDELIASGRVELSNEQRRWLEASGGTVLLPLRATDGLLGVLLLGRKSNGEDYTGDELDLLRSLGAQISLAAENIELLDDKVEKEKLEQQLEVARKIQEGLLPGRLPSARGLELAARIRFCLDVAGDYYDVVPLRDGRTLLAVGDVAGKGVGAALLMANLQASLRVVRNTGAALPDVMREINALVCENTPDELFITLFVGVFDPATGGLNYVNAGHNPPVLARADGSCERLGEGGLLLGVEPGAGYVQASLRLGPGDLLLMFTDGVSEAMNESRAEFGEERIERIACDGRTIPLEHVVDGLERDVIAFTGRETFQDDFTLLLARVAPASHAA